MKKHDMRSLLGIMRNQKYLLKEDENENTIETNLIDTDKESILSIINSIEPYSIFVNSITNDDNKILINGTYTYENIRRNIYMTFNGGDPNSSIIDIDIPESNGSLVLSANEESSIFEFYNSLYTAFKGDLFDLCISILRNV